jgi:LacI family transcriptional regulator
VACARRIGPDLAVTGFDGTAISRLIVPALTTVTMPLAQIAARLVDRVIAQAAGVSHDHGEILGTTVTWGQSV